MDYKEKIRRLLALAESPNENEAKSALLKARELMAEHKITHTDILESKSQKLSDNKTEWTCSKRRDPWMVQLAATIGEHYCCKAYISRITGKQTNTICFIGFEDDIDVCTEIFDYAARFISARTKDIKNEYYGLGAAVIQSESDSYGYGFIKGLNDAYDEQLKEQEQANSEWGLVLTVPKEVHEAMKDYKSTTFQSRSQHNIRRNNYLSGYEDGKKFDPEKMLKESREDMQMLDDDSMRHPVTIRLTDYSKKRK